MFKKRLAVLLASVLALVTSLYAQNGKITVQKDANGWRLLDGNTPVEVKGVVWAFTPIGETYNYNLFAHGDAFVQKMIDTDMPMLKAMGVNAIRCFSTIPPKWVEYIYTKYGIYTVVNDLLGRYGVSVNGTWHPTTDYSDYYTRETLINQAKATAEAYKDCKGVLMYLFGNESNYGLVWSSTEIENLPAGEANVVKAGYLYDLLEKAMVACKEIDPNRPVGIVNGDTQYLDLIKKLCPSLEVLGVNAYRGYKFYDSFYENIEDTLDKPVMLTEAGADAFNDILKQEDQSAQMLYLKTQWEEIYQQAYGKGKSQNMIGGFVFEWIDEWWKRYQVKNLDVHDDASWSNAGYELDYEDGKNNMSEEWFGICAQSTIKKDGINVRIPRAAYYMLQDLWKLPLYDSTRAQIDKVVAGLDDAYYLAKGNEKTVKQLLTENKYARISQADATVQNVVPVYANGVIDALKNGTKLMDAFRYQNADEKENSATTSAEATLGIEISPLENLKGEIVLRAWTNEPFSRIQDHWPVYYESESIFGANTEKDAPKHLKYVDVYSAQFSYSNSMFDINGYYHTGHAGFEGSGDPFWISKEAFDIIGYDTYGSKAPIAIEFIGKQALSGLQVIGGPEIWGGAAPQIQANYFKWIPSASIFDGFTINATYAEEFGLSENINIDPYNGYGAGRKISALFGTSIEPWFNTSLALLHAGSEKVGANYTDKNGQLRQITYLDTLGAQFSINTNMFQFFKIYSNVIYRGLVADTNAAMVRGGFLTGDSGLGNRFEVQLGTDIVYGNFSIRPVFRARVPLQGPMNRSLTAGSPFIVDIGNRQSLEAELVFTYDPEGGTWFHEWNIEDIEGAPFAITAGVLYQLYAGETDSLPFKSDTKTNITRPDGTKVYNYIWYEGGALPAQNNLWSATVKTILNPTAVPNLRIVANLGGGMLSATTGAYASAGCPEIVTFLDVGVAARYNHWIGSLSCSVNKWAPESWWRNFNQTFPLQYTLDIAYGFGTPSFLDAKNRIGIKLNGRIFGETSADPYFALPASLDKIDGAHYFELSTYFSIGL